MPGEYRGTQAQEALSVTGQLQPYKAHSRVGMSLASATSPVAIPNAKELYRWTRFPRGHLHVILRFSMSSKNQLKQKQTRAFKLGDTGMPTQSCRE